MLLLRQNELNTMINLYFICVPNAKRNPIHYALSETRWISLEIGLFSHNYYINKAPDVEMQM